jgi:ketosteroid isomerase-like protein/quercetin dioxygenase-like cupin family protein
MVCFAALMTASCAPSVNVEQERTALMQRDRDWASSAAKVDQFMTFLAPDASFYVPEMPVMTGTDAIKTTFTQMTAMPGFSLAWSATKADVSGDGNWGYTAGTYTSSAAGTKEQGKYVTIWKKVNGSWVVAEDIFNASAAPVYPHAMVQASSLKWGEAPPGLPAGGRFTVVSGDPSGPGPFVLRAELPAGYRIGPHWHPTTENVTVLSGTITMNMGDKDDPATRHDIAAGGYASLPAEARHSFGTKTAAAIQVHGMGPFGITYVNPADDPRNKK